MHAATPRLHVYPNSKRISDTLFRKTLITNVTARCSCFNYGNTVKEFFLFIKLNVPFVQSGKIF
jgi:hypothetical protein